MSPSIGRRELALLVLGAVALAVAMHWPLVLHLGGDVPKDLGDPLSQAWQVAWGGHALATQPLDFFQANHFWPERDSLAFSDALIGYAPAGLIGEGPRAAVARYDLLFLFAYALAFAGAYLLARELGVRPGPAAVAGAAFAYAPWRLEQDGHMHVISSGGIPLCLFLLARGYRRGNPALVVAGWLVAAWQLAIGFTLGLQLAYLLAVLALVAAVAWWRRGRPRPPRRLVAATLAGAGAFVLTAAVLARPYLRVLRDHPEAERTASDVATFAGPVWSFLVAPGENLVWGPITSPLREQLSFVPEQTLFPGLAILALAVLGATARAVGRRLRLCLAAAALGCAVLALGFPDSWARWLTPYWYLYELAPGWSGVRVPGRLMTLVTLALALLAGLGAERVLRRWAARSGAGGARGPAALRAALPAAALVALVALEGSGFDLDGLRPAGRAHPTVATAPPGAFAVPAPQLHLPATPDDNRRYLVWSTDGFAATVNGRASFIPSRFQRTLIIANGFPGRFSVAYLRRLGIRTVVLHRARLRGTPWERWRERPVRRLGLRREVRGGIVVYDLRPRRALRRRSP